jgi:hypothetical protein
MMMMRPFEEDNAAPDRRKLRDLVRTCNTVTGNPPLGIPIYALQEGGSAPTNETQNRCTPIKLGNESSSQENDSLSDFMAFR